MASTVYYRILSTDMYPDFGDLHDCNLGEGVDAYECLRNAYIHLIAKRLPSCLDWCGNELLIELDADNNVSEEDEAELADFDFGRITDEAWEELMQASDVEVVEMGKYITD